jgi:acetyl esterase
MPDSTNAFKVSVARMAAILVALSPSVPSVAQPPAPMTDSKPAPEFRNVAYGPHERHVLDLWLTEGPKPAPLLIFFHGGGFLGGDKWTLDPDVLERARAAGISVASANYRKSTHTIAPGPMVDGARAIQFLRSQADRFQIDSTRICASGNSAGAGIALWLGFHDDLADPASADPVLRESSRVTCLAVYGAQCSYDPRFVKKVIGGRAYEHPALPALFGLTLDQLDSPEAYELYVKSAPYTYIGPGDSPVIAYYTEPKADLAPGPNSTGRIHFEGFGQEIDGHDKPGWGIHHPKFGEAMKEKLARFGIECVLLHADDFPGAESPVHEANQRMVAFMLRHFETRP